MVSLNWFWDPPPPHLPKKDTFSYGLSIDTYFCCCCMSTNFCLDKLIFYVLTGNRFKAKTYARRFFIFFKGLSHSIPTNSTIFTSIISLCLRSDWHCAQRFLEYATLPYKLSGTSSSYSRFLELELGLHGSLPLLLRDLKGDNKPSALAKNRGLEAVLSRIPFIKAEKGGNSYWANRSGPNTLLLASLNEEFYMLYPEHIFQQKSLESLNFYSGNHSASPPECGENSLQYKCLLKSQNA